MSTTVIIVLMMSTIIAVIFLGVLLVEAWDDRAFHTRKGVRECNTKAQILLVSTDPDEIESWLLIKEPYITEALAKALLNRVIELKTERFLDEEWVRKMRVSLDIQPKEDLQLNDQEKEEPSKRKSAIEIAKIKRIE